MRVTLDVPEHLTSDLIQEHLDTGKPVQEFINSAIALYIFCKAQVKDGKGIAYGDKARIAHYNHSIDLERF